MPRGVRNVLVAIVIAGGAAGAVMWVLAAPKGTAPKAGETAPAASAASAPGRGVGSRPYGGGPAGGGAGSPSGLQVMAQTRSWVQSSLVSLGVGVQLPIPAAQKGKGVPVGTVKQGSPAQRGGIKAGDTVTGFDGKTISSALDLADAVSRSQPAARHSVMVLRGGKKVTVGVTGVKPSGLKRPAMPAAPGMGAGGM